MNKKKNLRRKNKKIEFEGGLGQTRGVLDGSCHGCHRSSLYCDSGLSTWGSEASAKDRVDAVQSNLEARILGSAET